MEAAASSNNLGAKKRKATGGNVGVFSMEEGRLEVPSFTLPEFSQALSTVDKLHTVLIKPFVVRGLGWLEDQHKAANSDLRIGVE